MKKLLLIVSLATAITALAGCNGGESPLLKDTNRDGLYDSVDSDPNINEYDFHFNEKNEDEEFVPALLTIVTNLPDSIAQFAKAHEPVQTMIGAQFATKMDI